MSADPLDPRDPREPLDALELAGLICAELDPLLTRHGFAPGQAGFGSTVGVVFCASISDFRTRFPALAPSIEGELGGCVDLNVYAGRDAHGRLHNISLEAVPLGELLAAEGAEFVGDAAAVTDLPARDGVARLREVLERLFARHTGD